MADTINSVNMLLPLPIVGVDPGPQYASDINNCLTLIDRHDHSPGLGVPIDPSGLNINSDLDIQDNSLVNTKSVVLEPQVSLSTLSAVYVVEDDLYFNDGIGNAIRLTQGGSIVGTSGSITGLVSPATASYVSVSNTFVWQSGVNIAANLDARNIILRNSSASSNGLTLSPPSAMASDIAITLPSLPATTKILRISSAGAISSTLDVDNSTVEISSNNIQIKNQGVTQEKLALRPTGTTVAAGGVGISTSSGVYTIGTSLIDIPNLSVTITTTGRPVMVCLQSDGTEDSDTSSYIEIVNAGGEFAVARNAVVVGAYGLGSGGDSVKTPASTVKFLDVVSAGTYTYTMQAKRTGGGTLQIGRTVLVVYEI